MMSNCTILVSSCDKYKDAWEPFFKLLKIFWKEIGDYSIVLSTEKEEFCCNELNISISHCLNSCSWSERLIHCLKEIKTKYVIFLLEDFFIQKQVDDKEIQNCIHRMENDPQIACFYFKKVLNSWKESPYIGYHECTPELKYRLNAQAAVWRKDALLEFLDSKENPWEFEIIGSARIKNTAWKLFCHKDSDKYYNLDGPFPYLIGWENGLGISRGKWLWNNKKLFRKHKIKVNYKNLGVAPKYIYGIGIYAKIRKILFPPLVWLRDKILKNKKK